MKPNNDNFYRQHNRVNQFTNWQNYFTRPSEMNFNNQGNRDEASEGIQSTPTTQKQSNPTFSRLNKRSTADLVFGSPTLFPYMNTSKDRAMDEDPVIEDMDESSVNFPKSAPRDKMNNHKFT